MRNEIYDKIVENIVVAGLLIILIAGFASLAFCLHKMAELEMRRQEILDRPVTSGKK